MPAKGKGRVSDTQRARIAAGRAAGKSSTAIATETGLSASTVKKQAGDKRTQLLVQQFKERDQAVLAKGWTKAITSILVHLESKDAAVVTNARRDLLRFLTAGDPPLIKLQPGHGLDSGYTLSEIIATYRKVTDG